MKVVYWSDYSCPFCYIGEARLKKAAEEAGVNIVPEMKAFQLDPTAGLHAEGDTVSRFAKKYGLSMESAAHRIDMISEMGRGEGIDFRYATTLFTNTMDAHRLTKFAFYKGGPVLAEQIAEKLYAAYFIDNLELADHSVLKRIAMECGLDEADMYNEKERIAFVGDTIFKESIGNYTFPGGNKDLLIQSIMERVFTLPDDTVLYSGHSEPTTVGAEKRFYGM